MKQKVLIGFAIVISYALLASVPASGEDVAALWKAKCSSCHAADGSGATPAGKKLAVHDMRSPAVQQMKDAELVEITAKGKNKMPAYEKKLTEQQIKDLVAYIRTLGKTK